MYGMVCMYAMLRCVIYSGMLCMHACYVCKAVVNVRNMCMYVLDVCYVVYVCALSM